MKNLLRFICVSFFKLYLEIRKLFWSFRKKITKTITLKLSAKDNITILTKGEIVGILYYSQPEVYFNKGFEHNTIELMRNSIKEGMTVFDIGANIGIYSIFISKLVGPSGKVFAFEPDKSTFDILSQNIALSNCKNIIPINIAISDSNSFVRLNKPASDSGDAYNYIDIVNDPIDEDNLIKSMTIDQFIYERQLQKIDFIKIDIEGAEMLCLSGANHLLTNSKSLKLVCECYEDFLKRFGNRTSDLIVYMDRMGYVCDNYDDYQWCFYKE